MSGANAFSLAELAAILALRPQYVAASGLLSITTLAAASVACFKSRVTSNSKAALQSNTSSAVIRHPEYAADYAATCLIAVDPCLAFRKLSAQFEPKEMPLAGLYPSAVVVENIDESAGADTDSRIG